MTDGESPALPAANPRQRAGGGRMPSQDELPIRPKPTLFFRAVRAAVWALAHTLFSVRVSGSRDLRKLMKSLPPSTPIIYVANHLSMVDGPLLEAVLPARPRIHALAAGEILTATKMRWWFVRHIGGVFPVDRGADAGRAVNFDAVYEAMRRPEPVALLGFPEGRIGKVEGRLNHEPKSGLVQFGMNTGAVEIPIGLTGTTRLWFRRRIKIKIGTPVQYQPGMTVGERVATQAAAIEALTEPYQQAFGPKYLQWLFPQTRTNRAHWRAEREGWNAERLVPRFVSAGGEPLTATMAGAQDEKPPATPLDPPAAAAPEAATPQKAGPAQPKLTPPAGVRPETRPVTRQRPAPEVDGL